MLSKDVNHLQKPLYSGAPDLAWVPSTRVSSPLPKQPTPAPAPVAKPAPLPLPVSVSVASQPLGVAPAAAGLSDPVLPTPVPSVRQVVREAASRWKTRNGALLKQAKWVADAVPAQSPLELTTAVPQAAVDAVSTVQIEHEVSPAPAEAALEPAPLQAAVATLEPAPAVVQPVAEPVEVPVAAEPVSTTVVAATEPEEAAPVAAQPEEVPAQAEGPAPVAEAPAAPAPAAPVERRGRVPMAVTAVEAPVPLEASELGAWDVVLLAGPAGSGKSSVGRLLTQLCPRGAYLQLEPLRDKAFSSLIVQVLRDENGEAESPIASASETPQARERAVEFAKGYLERGMRIVLDDCIENAAELKTYMQELDGLTIKVVTLMPSYEELERRDRFRPAEQQVGTRLKEQYANMVRQLAELSESVFDTSQETVQETVQHILDSLK